MHIKCSLSQVHYYAEESYTAAVVGCSAKISKLKIRLHILRKITTHHQTIGLQKSISEIGEHCADLQLLKSQLNIAEKEIS